MKPNSGSPQRRELNSPLLVIQKAWPAGTTDLPATTHRAEALNAEPLSQRSTEDYASVPMSSSCGDYEGHAREKACPSDLSCSGCAEVVHELANLMTAVLVNAQVLGWKLPPYSHLKRPVREVERNAQRGGELLKRLMVRCTGDQG